ncbi:TMEM175 family protein [Corynebacterium falsenii]|uniref:DUF1211 domain-containing protein n=1 Tax=Corynebacterium falsenii TaxID=108486 RepID=A0A418Q9B5_9CORY|nr:TMEM175 family protein [Corynebacterium falsenii]MDC7104046.1 TMEM175 family protein [Corynebacterium falsenii]RIX36274.1 DUF1211 domain-containing protein [Corynebacterium falsenii]
MPTSRLEAFSDGVLAIIITIMVLELPKPEGASLGDLWHSTGVGFFSYVLSFVYVGIYWNNHHHFFHVVDHVTGTLLWANLNSLFWLSLLPFSTGWMAETSFAPAPILVYGVNLLSAGVAYLTLQRVAISSNVCHSRIKRALDKDRKGPASFILYAVGVICAAISLWGGWHVFDYFAVAAYVVVAILWVIPDKRMEKAFTEA